MLVDFALTMLVAFGGLAALVGCFSLGSRWLIGPEHE
jgi:hypothetical protein